MDKTEKIMSLIESVEDEIAEAVILADRGYTDEAKESYAKAISIKEQIKCVLCELYGEEAGWQEVPSVDTPSRSLYNELVEGFEALKEGRE